jgi:hypothetical protein
MIELKHDTLVFRFPEVHPDAVLEIDFQRTLRIPNDDRTTSFPRGSAASRCGTWTTTGTGCRSGGCGVAG